MFIISHNSVWRKKKSTIGWDLLVQWKDSSISLTLLKDMKTVFPIEMAEYAVANKNPLTAIT